MDRYELIVIGSGPAGEKAAVKAAYFGYSTALIEKEKKYGGAGVQMGTIPSKTLKESALYFSGVYEKGIYGLDYKFSHRANVDDFMYRKNLVSKELGQEVAENLLRHNVEVIRGSASFVDPHIIKIQKKDGPDILIYGKKILIATGSYPFHPGNIPFDGKRVHDSDSILEIERFPNSILVLGAGVIGCEYATIYSAMEIKVHLVNNKNEILGFADHEISASLISQMMKKDISIHFNVSVESLMVPENEDKSIEVKLTDGQVLKVDMFLFAAGRNGNTRPLKCKNAGLEVTDREALKVNEQFQTSIPHIYSVGDVIGFPALASTSMDQGRMAVEHMFHAGDLQSVSNIFPYGIYTIPEISMVGLTEQQTKDKKINYCLGFSRYKDVARARIVGIQDEGFMKIIIERESRIILGVHIIGKLASEIIHYGLTLVQDKKTIGDVISTVFNYPTLHDLYKYASYDCLGNLAGHKLKIQELVTK